ncbi:hypothetical protein [Spirosoma pomorum]
MLKLKLTRDEVGTIYSYCSDGQVRFDDTFFRQNMGVNSLILAEHYERIRRQWFTWSTRPTTKEFWYSVSVSLAFALHTELQIGPKWPAARTLLDKLNQALVNIHINPQTVESHD